MTATPPVYGTAGTDFLDGGPDDDTFYGLGGNDQLRGFGGNDLLDGGAGNDILIGGDGTDTLTGGTGADIFQDTAAGLNGDTITDFLIGDRIQITDVALANAQLSVTDTGISYNGSDFVNITGLGPGRLVVRPLQGTGFEIRLQEPAHNDVNGDGRSDVIWRNSSTGDITDWIANANGTFAGNTLYAHQNASAAWHVVGTGDFNGDGRVDILWRNDNGKITDWLGNANGGFNGNLANADNSVTSNWQVIATGDFNGDGRSDILWRNTDNGNVTDWLGQANGGFASNGPATNNVGSVWKVAGTGDVNGDGIDDVIWRNTNTGDVTDWLGNSNGGFAGNTQYAHQNASAQWHLIGVGDFNGDGMADILWRNDAGKVTDWVGNANGGFNGNLANADNSISSSWQVVAIGDYNGDAHDDILWQNTNTGVVTDWLATTNGGFTGNPANGGNHVDNVWHVQPTEVLI
jgi:hypothetical protein